MIKNYITAIGLVITALVNTSCCNKDEFYNWGHVRLQLCINNDEIIIYDGNNKYLETLPDSSSTSKFLRKELEKLENADTVRILCDYSEDIEIPRKREFSIMAGNLTHQFNSKPVIQFLFFEDKRFRICTRH